MAASTCYYHPSQVASTACTQCGIALCGSCVQTVANRPLCQSCVSAIRSRVASQMNQSPLPQTSGNATVSGGTGGNPYAQAPNYAQAQVVSPPPAASVGPVGLLLGFVFGALIGIVGAFILAKVEFYSNFEIGYLNSLVGFGCGYGVVLGSKRGGMVPAILGGILAFFAMILSEYFFFQDALTRFAAQNPGAAANVAQVSFADYLSHIGLDWLFIAIGVYGGVRTPLRAAR